MPSRSQSSRGSRVRGEVEKAVAAEVRRLKVADAGEAAVALSLAREMDVSGNSATSKSMCAKALMEAMERLRAMAPPAETKDGVDEIAAKRAARVARRSAAQG